MPMTLYESYYNKIYRIPVTKAQVVLSKLDKALEKEESRVQEGGGVADARASFLIRSLAQKDDYHLVQNLRSIDLDALRGSELVVQLPAATINERTGRIDRDCLEGKDYATLQLDGDILQVTIPRQAGFALCPAAVDAVLEKYII